MQSTRPAPWANLVAWPAGAWVINRWLASLAYRLDLRLLRLAAATAITLALAVVTVMERCYRAARESP